jgi:hypothetical protein
MKRVFCFLFILGLMIPAAVNASPYLVCDSYPAGGGQPTAFVVMEGTVSSAGVFVVTKTYPDSPAKINTDGTATLFFDTNVMSNGLKAVTVKAKNAGGESAASSPFTFTLPVPVAPAVPTGFSLVSQ